jgi:hypothetical protein
MPRRHWANGEWGVANGSYHSPFAIDHSPHEGIANRTRGRYALAGPDHVQGGGSFPRAVWMARTIVEAGAPVNTAAIAVSSSSMRPSKSYALRATIEIKVIR